MEQIGNLCTDRYVERRDGLIRHDQIRLDSQRTRNRNALALAARKGARQTARGVPLQPDLLQ